MECCTCVEKAAKLTQGLLKRPWNTRFKKDNGRPVPGQSAGDKRPASRSGSPVASPKRPKTGDSEPANEATDPDLWMELAKSPTPPSVPTPHSPPKAPTPPTGPTEDDGCKFTGEKMTRIREPDVATRGLEQEEKVQRVAEIRARAARDEEAVWAWAEAEVAEIMRREQRKIDELP